MYCSASYTVSVLSVTPQSLEVNQTPYADTSMVKDADFTGEAKSPRRGQIQEDPRKQCPLLSGQVLSTRRSPFQQLWENGTKSQIYPAEESPRIQWEKSFHSRNDWYSKGMDSLSLSSGKIPHLGSHISVSCNEEE